MCALFLSFVLNFLKPFVFILLVKVVLTVFAEVFEFLVDLRGLLLTEEVLLSIDEAFDATKLFDQGSVLIQNLLTVDVSQKAIEYLPFNLRPMPVPLPEVQNGRAHLEQVVEDIVPHSLTLNIDDQIGIEALQQSLDLVVLLLDLFRIQKVEVFEEVDQVDSISLPKLLAKVVVKLHSELLCEILV